MNIAVYEITTPIAMLLHCTCDHIYMRACVAGVTRGMVGLMNCACMAAVDITP